MENLEQIISKQNNIKEKITEYNNELELYNKTYIEKFTELKSLSKDGSLRFGNGILTSSLYIF